MSLSPHSKRVQIARSTLLLDQPFFGVLSLGLRLVEDPSCKTAWTDGESLGYSPAFVDTLTNDQLVAVVAHEVMHCACGHPWRRNGRDAHTWNKAADYAINSVLQEAGFELPASVLIDPQYAGKWAEWIYDRLPKPKPDPQSGPQPGQGPSAGPADPSQLGEVRDAPTTVDAPTEADWQQQTQQAIRTSRGTLPASLKSEITEATRARQDWRSLLRRYVQEITRSDYAWSRPNVRYIPLGLYLPALYAQSCGKLTIAVDTSGSIDQVLLGQFASEVQAIASELQPTSIDVIYCDARVHRVDHFEQNEPITMQAIGRGGTSFIPVFEHIAKGDDQPVCLIYLTDLDGSFPDQAPGYPVIWAAYGSTRDVPFGDVVTCE